MYGTIRKCASQFKIGSMARVYVMSITRSTMYQKAPFCQLELAYGKFGHVGTALSKEYAVNFHAQISCVGKQG